MKKLTPILFFIAAEGFAQAPVINNVQPIYSGPAQKIVIAGSGFSTTPANNTVWFDHVRGTVTAATAYSLEVQVPNQARYSNVEVIVGNLSAKSPMKFAPSYGGISLDATKLTSVLPTAAPYIDGNEQFDVASADLDMDGDPDFVTTRGGPTSGAAIQDLTIYQNTTSAIGNLTFNKIVQSLTLGAPTANVTCGDLNGDGKPDILASRGGNGNSRNEVFVLKNANTTPGTMAFTNQAKIVLPANQLAFRISISDLNGDGKPDVVVSNAYDDQIATTDVVIYVYPNQSTPSTISFGGAIPLTVTGAAATYGLDVQDFDGDGRPDIVVNQFNKADVFFFRNTSTGNISFGACQRIPTAGSFIQLVSADLNNDGKLDLAGVSANPDNKLQIWTNSSTPGTIAFTAQPTISTDVGPWGIDVGDIDGDGDVDIAVACISGTNINVFRQDGLLSFTKLDIPVAPNSNARNLRIGDYDGDGKPDIAYTAKPVSGLQNIINVLRNGNCWNPAITGSSNTICTGQTIPLQTKPAFGVNFDWKLGGVSQTLGSPPYNFSATAAGTYSVTLTGTVDTGCSNTSANYVLTQDVATFPTDPAITNNVPCLNSSLNLSTGAVATATYQWTGPNGFTSTSQTPVVTPVTLASAGNYTLQLTLANGCQSNKVTKLLDVASVPILPVVASPAQTGCVGGAITMSVSNNATYTYQWNKNSTPIGGQTTSSLSLPSLAPSDEAKYSVSVTSTLNTCTQETAQAQITVLTSPSAAFTISGTQCLGSTITFTDASTKDSRGTLTYSWTFGDTGPNSTSPLTSPTHVYNTASTFSASLSVSYSGACTSSSEPKSIVIANAVKPVISTTASAICAGDQATLSVAGSYTSFTWTGVTGTTSSVTITTPGKYKVNTLDANGCASADSLVITAKPLITPFVATSKRSTITLGDTTQLSATAGADSYLWNFGKTLTDSTSANPIAKPQSTTDYIVIAKKTGSCDASDTITVRVDVGSPVIKPPVLFSPNGDAVNDTWQIPETTGYPDWTMTIYDGRGSQIYQQKGYNSANAWDGNYSGKASPDGTYFYVFSNSKDKPLTGSVLLVR